MSSILNELFKSMIDTDDAPVVICDAESTVVYMNPAALRRYHIDLTGRSIFDCQKSKVAGIALRLKRIAWTLFF